MDALSFIREPEKKIKSLIKKITHSGETDLDKELLLELKSICKVCKDDLMILVHKESIKCLHKEHSQVRVTTVKLIDYLFQKSHIIREKLLDDFDIFLELTLAISQRPKVKLKLPPPKKYATLLQELTAKLINSWHSEYSCGYEKLRYTYRFLREHKLVDFNAFRVQNHEELIKRQKLAERQEKILTRSIENRLKELRLIKPEIENLLAQIDSLIDLLVSANSEDFPANNDPLNSPSSLNVDTNEHVIEQQQHGIVNLSQNIQIEFSPFVEVQRNRDNKEVVQSLKELKKELVESKLTKLIAIEKTLIKRSEQFVNTLKEIIDLKTKSMNIVLKLGELKIVNDFDDAGKGHNLDNVDSDESDEFEDVQSKEGLETYIPKSMRYEYGLEAINPKELDDSRKVTLIDESFSSEASSSSSSQTLVRICNVRLESGKLCPRRDKIKCPFHGRIIARDHKGVPLDEQDRLKEEEKNKKRPKVPEWQDPDLLRDLKAATGVDLTMPTKKGKFNASSQKKLANTKTCDLTPKQRLEKRLRMLTNK